MGYLVVSPDLGLCYTLGSTQALDSLWLLVCKVLRVGHLTGLARIMAYQDILFASAFDQLRIPRDRLRPVTTTLVGFKGSSTKPLGMIELPVLVGTHP